MHEWCRAAALAVGLGVCAVVGSASASTVIFFDGFEDDAYMHNSGLTHWNVTSGSVDVVGGGGHYDWWPGGGRYLDLDGSGSRSGRIETKATFELALGGVFIQAIHAIAHASAIKALKDETVFSQRRAILRKRLILLKKHSTRWRSL